MSDKHRYSVLLEKSKLKLSKIVGHKRMQNVDVSVLVRPLTAEEAIGEPGRRDFLLLLHSSL